ncbi:hypothetical protein QLX08_002315 [Tetragonisca angustula]|uniref:Transmembrane protein n=1 Tax=Tetragonisca angustula TaxID=166442 RepID=A0AAW1ABU9_9HYME
MNEATKFFPFRILYQSTSGFYRQPSGIERYLALFRIMSTTNSGSESSDASVVARSEEREKESAARSRGGSSPSISVSSNRLVGKVIVAVKQVRRSKTSRTSGQRRNESKQKVHEGGRSLVSFCLFFGGTSLLTMSCTLLSSGVWCLLVRLPVIHLVQGPASILVVLTGYMVVAGAITFPASCLLYREHNVTEPHRPLLPVIALLSICTVFLTCCAVHAIVYRKSAYSDVEDSAISSVYNQLPKWVPQVTKHPV